jgi:hypothetical protein
MLVSDACTIQNPRALYTWVAPMDGLTLVSDKDGTKSVVRIARFDSLDKNNSKFK